MRCGKLGHWYSDRLKDGSLPSRIQSADVDIGSSDSAVDRHHRGADVNADAAYCKDKLKAVTLNMAILSSNEIRSLSSRPPPVDCHFVTKDENCATYSAIPYFQLCALGSTMAPQWDGELSPVPAEF